MSSAEFAAIRRRTHNGEERQMPLFMDVHNVEGGVSAADVAGAHEADLATQGAYGVNYLRVWVDQEAGKIFCLVDAPDAEAANTVCGSRHSAPAVLVHVAAVIVGVGDVGLAGLPAGRWRRSHKDAARATSLYREPCPRSTEWRGPPSRLDAGPLTQARACRVSPARLAVEALRPAPGEPSSAIVHRPARHPPATSNVKAER
jgi:hypothetical protein